MEPNNIPTSGTLIDGNGCSIMLTTKENHLYPFNTESIKIPCNGDTILKKKVTIVYFDIDGKQQSINKTVDINLETMEVITDLNIIERVPEVSESTTQSESNGTWCRSRRKWTRRGDRQDASEDETEGLNERVSINKIFSVLEKNGDSSKTNWVEIPGSLKLGESKNLFEETFPSLRRSSVNVAIQTDEHFFKPKNNLTKPGNRRKSFPAGEKRKSLGLKRPKISKRLPKSQSSTTSEDFDRSSIDSHERMSFKRNNISKETKRTYSKNQTNSVPQLSDEKNNSVDENYSDFTFSQSVEENRNKDHHNNFEDTPNRISLDNRASSPVFYGFTDELFDASPPLHILGRSKNCSYCDKKKRDWAEVQMGVNISNIICKDCFQKMLMSENLDNNKNAGTRFKQPPTGWSFSDHEVRTKPVLMCDLCAFEARSHQDMKGHEDFHDDESAIICVKCDFISKNISQARRHIALHKKASLSPGSKSKASSTTCQFCNLLFHSYNLFEDHLYSEHFPRFKFSCADCGFVTPFENCLINHVSLEHPNSRPFSCECCYRTFFSLKMLRRHQLHKKEKCRVSKFNFLIGN